MSIAVSDDSVKPADNASSPRRFVINVASNLLMLVLNSVVGIWLTSYLVQGLGVALYGLVALASSVTLYMSVITSSLNNAIGRFLTIDIKQGRSDEANRTFNTALWGSVGVCLLTLPGIGLVAFYTPQLFSVPLGHEGPARWLFAAVMGAYLVSVVRGVFTVSTFVHSRFDLQNLVLASNLIVRVLLVVALFVLIAPSLEAVGLATFVAALASFGAAWFVWRRLTPELRVAPAAFDLDHLRTISGTSIWFFINQVGTLLFLNIDLVVVNILLGAEAGGRYGIVLQWPLLLRTLATTVSSVLTPTILALYAKGDMAAVTRTARQAVKLLGLAMVLPIGLVCGFASSLLQVWLGPDFVALAPLMVVQVAHLSVNLIVLPLLYVQIALNKVKTPALVTLFMGLINLLLALWWGQFGAGGLGVALAGALVLTLKNGLFTPLYGARIQELPSSTYFRAMLQPVIATVLVGLVCYLLERIFAPQTWFSLGLAAGLVALVYALLAYTVGLNAAERAMLKRFLPGHKGD